MPSLSECLQMESELTLEKAKKLIRQREAVHQQQAILKSSNETSEAVSEEKCRVGRRQKRVASLKQPMKGQPLPNQPVQNAKVCKCCGKC